MPGLWQWFKRFVQATLHIPLVIIHETCTPWLPGVKLMLGECLRQWLSIKSIYVQHRVFSVYDLAQSQQTRDIDLMLF